MVIHDWGSGIGFLWAMRNAAAIKGIAYMESIVKPLTWADWPASAVGIFKGLCSEKGEDLILERNMFIEGVLPGSVMRDLSETEMARALCCFRKDTTDEILPVASLNLTTPR